MKTEKIKNKIVCDMPGCGNLAETEYKIGDGAQGLKLCENCAKTIYAELFKNFGKGGAEIDGKKSGKI